jgi:hypothetical protein
LLKKKPQVYALPLFFRVFESWTGGTTHPEVSATGELHQGFFTIFRVPKTNAKLGPKCKKN